MTLLTRPCLSTLITFLSIMLPHQMIIQKSFSKFLNNMKENTY